MLSLQRPTAYNVLSDTSAGSSLAVAMLDQGNLPPHAQHPAIGHLTLLVFEAVLEVVVVSAPGYIVARQGMFDADAQKLVANLNVMLFTPCLIFTKLASKLTADKLVELAVIPVIFVIQIIISYLCALVVSKLFGFSKRPRNFVIAMSVFGNSNSLPISLVLSLSQTIKGLHWDQIPGDNDDDVAARGILYLMIFQQLGQLVRWSWGYHVLLAPRSAYEEEDAHTNSLLESGESPYHDDPDEAEHQLLLHDRTLHRSSHTTFVEGGLESQDSGFGVDSEERTALNSAQDSSSSSQNSQNQNGSQSNTPTEAPTTPTNGNMKPAGADDAMISFPAMRISATQSSQSSTGIRKYYDSAKTSVYSTLAKARAATGNFLISQFDKLPKPLRSFLSRAAHYTKSFLLGVWAFMNPPLWAMLIAILVASIPSLQTLFFQRGTFVNNSITHAIGQSGGVAVPLILVVLGANLARNTIPVASDDAHALEDILVEKKLVWACLISRMLLPVIIMAPILAVIAKYVPVSILDDPIFVIVAFLLVGAPSALQLAQICQINGVYMGAISRLLFQSYVVWILPSTLILVMLALEVVEWAQLG